MTTGPLPESIFLYSVAGLGITLAGFSGLVGAFRRGGQWKPIDDFRLRQIPEMALVTTLLALITLPLADLTGSAAVAIQVAAGLGLAFTVGHVVVLIIRMRRDQIHDPTAALIAAGLLDIAIFVVASICLALAGWVAYESLSTLLLARPMLAFALVVGVTQPQVRRGWACC